MLKVTTLKDIFLIIVLCLIQSQAVANGGPVDGSAVYRTGDIKLLNTPQVQLIDEKLSIRLDGDYAIINVLYRLKNISDYSAVKVDYGFPVELIRTELNYQFGWEEDYIPYFHFKLDGKDLPLGEQLDIAINTLSEKDYSGANLEVKNKWYFTNFEIPKSAVVDLSVSYKVKNHFEDWAYSKSCFTEYSPRVLKYGFKYAKHWGNGKADRFEIRLDPGKIKNVTIKGFDFSKDGTVYHYSTTDFDFNQASDLIIEYKVGDYRKTAFVLENRLNLDDIKEINVSSQLEGNYHKQFLLDGDFSTAWVEGAAHDGKNEYIVVNLNDKRLAAILLINGYAKNEAVYQANNRIKKLKVEAEMVDHQDTQKTRMETYEVELKDQPYVPINKDNIFGLASLVADFGEGFQKIRKLRFTILDTYPGEKYNDTCISELFLVSFD